MTQETRRADLADGHLRVTVRLDEPLRDPDDSRAALHRLLENVGADDRLYLCDFHLPQKIVITTDGQRWRAEAVAIVRRPEGGTP